MASIASELSNLDISKAPAQLATYVSSFFNATQSEDPHAPKNTAEEMPINVIKKATWQAHDALDKSLLNMLSQLPEYRNLTTENQDKVRTALKYIVVATAIGSVGGAAYCISALFNPVTSTLTPAAPVCYAGSLSDIDRAKMLVKHEFDELYNKLFSNKYNGDIKKIRSEAVETFKYCIRQMKGSSDRHIIGKQIQTLINGAFKGLYPSRRKHFRDHFHLYLDEALRSMKVDLIKGPPKPGEEPWWPWS